jgi:plasmid maintenance system killer protein
MQERQGLRSRAARRLDLVDSGRLTLDLRDPRSPHAEQERPDRSSGVGVAWSAGDLVDALMREVLRAC